MSETEDTIHSSFSPPVCLVDSTVPQSIENINRVVDDAPLREHGFSPLPSSTDTSPYLLTIGVPEAWKKKVFDAACEGPSLDSNNKVAKRFFIGNQFDWRTLHYVLFLVRTRKTTVCYNTQGALSKTDESLRPGEDCKWIIERDYIALLHLISFCTKDHIDVVKNLDMSLRYKRAKRDPTTTVTTHEGRSFCFVGFINDNGMTEWRWVDISLSNDKPQQNFLQPTPTYAGPTCHVKGCCIFTGLMKCARCKAVYYCSNEHQKKDWSSHKALCNTQ